MGIPAAAYIAASGLPPYGDQANAVLSGTITAIGPTAPFSFRGPMNLAIWAAINTALTTTAGSLAATVASAAGLAVGNAINSVNVPKGATIGALAGTAVTLALPPIALPGQVQPGYAQITGLPSTAGLLGATVTGPGIPAGTTVLAISVAAVPATTNSPGSPGSVQLSAAVTALPASANPLGAQNFSFAPNGNAITATGADAAATFTGAAISYVGSINLERSFDGGLTFTLCNIGSSGTLAQWATGTPVSVTFGEPEKNVLYRLNCTAYTSGKITYRISQTGGAAESLAIGPLVGG